MAFEHKLTIVATIELTVFTQEDKEDFENPEKSKFLMQELLDQSVWADDGIICNTVDVKLKGD